ncbi:hypothetical protein [Actinomyces ruminis]|nr:hypothetical protein [Actinomyces ruminis]
MRRRESQRAGNQPTRRAAPSRMETATAVATRSVPTAWQAAS